VLVSGIKHVEDSVSRSFGHVGQYQLHCNWKGKKVKWRTLDKDNVLASMQIGLFRKFFLLWGVIIPLQRISLTEGY